MFSAVRPNTANTQENCVRKDLGVSSRFLHQGSMTLALIFDVRHACTPAKYFTGKLIVSFKWSTDRLGKLP